MDLPFGHGTLFQKSREIAQNYRTGISLRSSTTSSEDVTVREEGKDQNASKQQQEELNPDICSDFMVLVCSSTSCAKKRSVLQMDEYSTFGGLYVRREETGKGAEQIRIEESSCLGSCQMAPCVAVQHEDFVGTVALEGMRPNEFEKRVFHNIVTESDIDRVWDSVENAVRVMMQEEDNDENDDADEEAYHFENDDNYV